MVQSDPGGGNGVGAVFRTGVNWLGALFSISLVLGIAIWSYNLITRDVDKVPVIRAAEGPVRIAPEDPGGRPAAYQGLAVNRVQAEGTAEAPADRLALAPRPVGLSTEDKPRAALPQRTPDPADAAGKTGGKDEAGQADPQSDAPADGRAGEDGPAAAAGEVGGESAPTPTSRPEEDPVARAVAKVVENGGTASGQAASRKRPDAPLAQIGAFRGRAAAQSDWKRLAGRFPAAMQGKRRVVQKVTSDGRALYRLRAAGFEGRTAAERFCAALRDGGAGCFPVAP